MQVPWERTTHGHAACRVAREAIASPHVHSLAWQAFSDVTRIRADFGNGEIAFEPCLKLGVRRSQLAVGWSLFVAEGALLDDTVDSVAPDLCLRMCTWDNAEAARGLAAADNQSKYLVSSLPLRCTLRFISSRDHPAAPLVGQTARVLAGGVSFERQDRRDEAGEVDLWFNDGLNRYQLAYFPATSRPARLEGLFVEWQAYFDRAERVPEHRPAGDVVVEHRESLWEHLQRYV